MIHSILGAPILAKVDDNALVSFSILNSAHPIPRHMQLDWNWLGKTRTRLEVALACGSQISAPMQQRLRRAAVQWCSANAFPAAGWRQGVLPLATDRPILSRRKVNNLFAALHVQLAVPRRNFPQFTPELLNCFLYLHSLAAFLCCRRLRYSQTISGRLFRLFCAYERRVSVFDTSTSVFRISIWSVPWEANNLVNSRLRSSTAP